MAAIRHAQKSVSLLVEALVAGGDGIGHVDHDGERRAVFLPRTVPGDEVLASVDFSARTARATSMAIVSPSAARVTPPCPIVDRCGGCDWMHVATDVQREAHATIVKSALARVTTAPTVISHRAPATERYRTRTRLLVEASRGRVHVGFRAKESHRLAPIEQCLVLDEKLERCLPLLIQSFTGESGAGEVHMALGPEGRPVWSLSWESSLSGGFFGRLDALVKEGALAGVEVTLAGASRPATIGDPTAETLGGDGESLRVPAASFAQTSPAVSLDLARRAIELLDAKGKSVVELFSGAGNLTVALARVARSVVCVEADARAISAARDNLAARALSVRLVEADADAFPIPPEAKLVLLDPPRSGAAGAVANIAASRVLRLVYVSCDPATLARDVRTLASAGFSLDAVETFEMFPHTSHVEVVALLTRSRGRGGTISSIAGGELS